MRRAGVRRHALADAADAAVAAVSRRRVTGQVAMKQCSCDKADGQQDGQELIMLHVV